MAGGIFAVFRLKPGLQPAHFFLRRPSMELAMIGKWTFRMAALALAGLQATAVSRADTPWSDLLSINRVEADQTKPYTLQQDHGPWIIMACSFNGQNAQQRAHELVMELRKKYRMEAFVYLKKFDLDDPNGNALPIYASPHRHQYQMVTENPAAFAGGEIKEIAVVVGNFPAVDDPDAQKTLQKLKAADPVCLHSPEEAQSLSLGSSAVGFCSIEAASKPDRWAMPSSPAIRSCRKTTSPPRAAWTNWC